MKKNKKIITIFTQFINFVEYEYDTETIIISVGTREIVFHNYNLGRYERFLEDVKRNNKIEFEMEEEVDNGEIKNVDIPDFSKIKKLKDKNDENEEK